MKELEPVIQDCVVCMFCTAFGLHFLTGLPWIICFITGIVVVLLGFLLTYLAN